MEELDWYREELDGRKQCPSQHRETVDSNYHPRCRLETGHALDHAGDGWTWSDEQEMTSSRFDLEKVLKISLWVLLVSAIVSILYAFYSLTGFGPKTPPTWWYFVNYGSTVGIIAISIILNRRKR